MPLRSDPRCIDCFRRGLSVFLKRAGTTAERASCLLEDYICRIEASMETEPPPVAGAGIYREIRELAPHPDIYMTEKGSVTSFLLSRAGELRERFESTGHPLPNALRASTWGNLLDVAQGRELPGEEDLMGILSASLVVDDTGDFLNRLAHAKTLLILGDNAGETVLDRLFLELSGFDGEVFYAVRPAPVLNDATGADAAAAGLDRFSSIVDTGYDAPTVVSGRLSDEMQSLLDSSDLILSKGQGNLEGLFGAHDSRLYYSFVVKCPVVAEILDLPEGSGVFASSTKIPGREF